MAVAKRNHKSVGNIPTGQGLTFEKVWTMFQETDRKIKELSKNIGGLNNGLGAIIESFVQGGLKNFLESKGFSQVEMYNNVEIKNKAYRGEIDCIAFGMYEKKKYTFLCECKNQMEKEDVEDFTSKVGTIRKGLLATMIYNAFVTNSNVCVILGYSKITAEARRITLSYDKKNNNLIRLKVGGDNTIVED